MFVQNFAFASSFLHLQHPQQLQQQPDHLKACSVHSLQDKIEGGIRIDRCQVASFLPAEVFSFSPVLLVGAPQVAVLPVRLPVAPVTVGIVDTADIVGSDTECSLTPEAKLSLFYKIFHT